MTLIATNHKGAQSQLGKKQINQLCKSLEKHIYLTTSEVIEYVYDKFGIVYSLSGMRDTSPRLRIQETKTGSR